MRHSSILYSKPTPHTSLFPNDHRPRYWLCATWSHPTSFGGVKTAQNSAPRKGIHAQAGEIHYEGWSLVWLGILGTWHIFFIAVVTILMLTSCFISNYRAQASPAQAARRRLVACSTPSLLCEVSSNYTSQCSAMLAFSLPHANCLHDPSSFYHSETLVAVPRRVDIP